MGAVAGKAVEDFATTVAATQAEDRLAVAEHAILACHRSTGVGIWGAEGTCTDRSLLAAVDEIVLLKEIHAFPMASAARRRMDGALRIAMSRLMEEFHGLRVWDASQLEGRRGLRFAVEKLSVSVGAAGGLSLAFHTCGSTSTVSTTGELSLSTVDELYVSSGSQSDGPDVVAVFLDETFQDELDLICPASLHALHEISVRVIRAGYTKELLHTFTNAPCDVLHRFLSILQVECSAETDQSVSFEDAEWWTAEDMIKRWILATKLVVKALVVMQRQLHAQSYGAFDRFKNDYFSAIAKRNTFFLLKFADGFTCTRSPDKLVYVLDMYEVLSNAVPALMFVFTGQHRELISQQVGVVLAKLARALRIMIGGLVAKIRTGGSQAQSAAHGGGVGVGVGVHPLTRFTMACVESLAAHSDALGLILAGGSGCGESAGGVAESVSSLGDLVSELITSLDPTLESAAAALRSADGTRSRHHLFLANNGSFVLKHAAADAGVRSLLGDEWAARRRSRIEQHVGSYVEASWAPVVVCFEAVGGGKPARILAEFNAALEEAYSGQVCCEVPDPALRAALRKAVSEKVVLAYNAYLMKHPKVEKSARYTAENLDGLLSLLFEG